MDGWMDGWIDGCVSEGRGEEETNQGQRIEK